MNSRIYRINILSILFFRVDLLQKKDWKRELIFREEKNIERKR